jgi:hypothetical protein
VGFAQYFSLPITQNLQHTFGALFFIEHSGEKFSIIVFINDDVPGAGYQTVFDTTIPAERILIGACMEKSDIEFLIADNLGHIHLIDVYLRVVVIRDIATETPNNRPLIHLRPVIAVSYTHLTLPTKA